MGDSVVLICIVMSCIIVFAYLTHIYCINALKTTNEMRKLHNELNEKVSEIKCLQLELTRQEHEVAGGAIDSSKRLIETLEKENITLKVCRFCVVSFHCSTKSFYRLINQNLIVIFDIVLLTAL